MCLLRRYKSEVKQLTNGEARTHTSKASLFISDADPSKRHFCYWNLGGKVRVQTSSLPPGGNVAKPLWGSQAFPPNELFPRSLLWVPLSTPLLPPVSPPGSSSQGHKLLVTVTPYLTLFEHINLCHPSKVREEWDPFQAISPFYNKETDNQAEVGRINASIELAE